MTAQTSVIAKHLCDMVQQLVTACANCPSKLLSAVWAHENQGTKKLETSVKINGQIDQSCGVGWGGGGNQKKKTAK